MVKKYEVKKSAIHGQGLFATEEIKRGELIGVIKYHTAKRDGPYVLWIGGNQGVRVTSELKYINHSKTPNAAYYDNLEVVALRKIRKGEEITHDYGADWAE